MANSKYEYVKKFETDDALLPSCWIVIRIDGKGFTRFCELHQFAKPNDKRALDLMDASAQEVLRVFPDVVVAYGDSDEYSFVFHRDTDLYGRRSSKLVSLVTSCFTASYVRQWPHFLAGVELQRTPMFDGRAVAYPLTRHVRDYLSWRQADAHINNQYNTCFWALVHSGCTPEAAQQRLKGTDAGFKNELLYSEFGINYNNLPDQFKKGSVLVRERVTEAVKTREDGTPVKRERSVVRTLYCDIIGNEFWTERPHLLGSQTD